jgi:hypothetical protein
MCVTVRSPHEPRHQGVQPLWHTRPAQRPGPDHRLRSIIRRRVTRRGSNLACLGLCCSIGYVARTWQCILFRYRANRLEGSPNYANIMCIKVSMAGMPSNAAHKYRQRVKCVDVCLKNHADLIFEAGSRFASCQ